MQRQVCWTVVNRVEMQDAAVGLMDFLIVKQDNAARQSLLIACFTTPMALPLMWLAISLYYLVARHLSQAS